jgi:hypothetical protein
MQKYNQASKKILQDIIITLLTNLSSFNTTQNIIFQKK